MQNQLDTKVDLVLGGLSILLDKSHTKYAADDNVTSGYITPPSNVDHSVQFSKISPTKSPLVCSLSNNDCSPGNVDVSLVISGSLPSHKDAPDNDDSSLSPDDPHRLTFAQRRQLFATTVEKPKLDGQKFLVDSKVGEGNSFCSSCQVSCDRSVGNDSVDGNEESVGNDAQLEDSDGNGSQGSGAGLGQLQPLWNSRSSDMRCAGASWQPRSVTRCEDSDCSDEDSSEDVFDNGGVSSDYDWSKDPEYIAFINGTWHEDLF